MRLWSARPERWAATRPADRGRVHQLAQRRSPSCSAARPPRRATRAASRRRASRSRAWAGPRSRAAAAVAIAARCRRLPCARAHPLPRGNALDEAHQLDVEERHPLLQARRHRHLVGADQQAVREEHVGVQVERLLHQAAVANVAEHVVARAAVRSAAASCAGAADEAGAFRSSAVISTSRTSRCAESAGLRAAGPRAGRARCPAPAEGPRLAADERADPGGRPAPARRQPGGDRSRRGARRRPGPTAPPSRSGRRSGIAAAAPGAEGIPHGLLQPSHGALELGQEGRLAPWRCRCARCRSRAPTARAYSRSSITSPWPGKPIVKVRGRRPSAAAIAAAIAAESTPPERNAPYGTSDIICRSTASTKRPASSLGQLRAAEPGQRLAGCLADSSGSAGHRRARPPATDAGGSL